MNHRSKLRISLLAATLAAAAAPALAQTVQITTAPIVSGYYYVPADGRYYAVPATTEYYVTPVIEERITIYADRATGDQLITNDVVDAIAADPRITGYVGVETRDGDVTLSGLVSTPGQALRAGRDARGVDGVRDLHNNVRARVGG